MLDYLHSKTITIKKRSKKMSNSKLTPRTRIQYRLTTNPADMGYDGTPSSWLAAVPDAVGTPLTICKKRQDILRRTGLMGSGTYYREQYRLTDGTIITAQDMDNYEAAAEYQKWNNK
jgi:hypothetical protein